MKIIPTDKISAIAATSEHANFPKENLSDDHPKRYWKAAAGVSEATLTFTISGGASSALAIFNTNATSISVVITDPNAIEWEEGTDFEDGVSWSNAENAAATEITNIDGVSGAYMVQWDEANTVLSVAVTLSNTNGEDIYAGVARAGKLYSYNGPAYGFTEVKVPLGFTRVNSNGSVYIKNKGTVREFSISSLIDRDDKLHEFMGTVFEEVQLSPAAWLVTNVNNSRWLVFARFISWPEGVHSLTDDSEISFGIREVI